MEWIFAILAFVLFILLWMATGHGMWLVLAAIGKAMFGDPAPKSRCSQCGATDGVVRGRCRFCGAIAAATFSPGQPLATPSLTHEIEGTIKQLERMWRRGLMTDDEHARLLAACQRDLDRLRGAAPAVQRADDGIAFVSPAPVQPIASVAPSNESIDDGIEIIDAEVMTPPKAKRALADVLSAFMQERNIRWGELASGLLIVGSAAGLVLSLRQQLNEWIPFFPALLFLLATAAMHGAGLYTLRKWNLQSTSRGVLLITLLLVPLNFLAAILIGGDKSQQIPVASLTYLAAVTIGLLSYGAITITGGRALLKNAWPALAIAVFGASVPQLAINRLMMADAPPERGLWLGAAAVGAFIAGVMVCLIAGRSWRRVSLQRAQPLLMTLGLGGFAVALPLALVVMKSDRHWLALAQLSPVFALLGATVVAAGLFLAQRTNARKLAPLAVVGSSLTVFGGVLMLVAVGFAWPDPMRLVAVGTLCAVALAVQSYLARAAVLHVPAVACAALAALVGFHLLEGQYTDFEGSLSARMVETWLMGRSALVLTALAAAVVVYGGILWKNKLRDHALYLLASAGGLMVVSLAIAAYSGFLPWGNDAPLATITFAIYATALTIGTFIYPHRALTVASSLVWLIANVHGVGFNEVAREHLASRELLLDRPVLIATLWHGLSVALAAVGCAWYSRAERWRSQVVEPLAMTAFGVSLTALWFAVAVREQQFGLHAAYIAAIAFAWLISAAILRAPQGITAGQALASLGVAYGAIALGMRQTWFTELSFDPRIVAMVIGALALWGIAWTFARRVSARWRTVHELLAPPWPMADQVVLATGVVVALLGTAIAISLGVLYELGGGAWKPAHEAEILAWLRTWQHPLVPLAAGALAMGVAIAYWERRELAWVLSLMLLTITVGAIFALQYVDQVAVASALRWALGAILIAFTALICARRQLAALLNKLPLGGRGELPPYASHVAVGTALAGAALPIVGLTIFACALAAEQIVPRGPLAETFFADVGWTVSYASPLAIIVAALLALGLRQRQPAFVLAGSAVWQLVVTLGCVMPVLTTGGAFDRELWATLWQWNVAGLGIYAIVWLALERWLVPRVPGEPDASASGLIRDRNADPLLAVQIAVLFTSLCGFALWVSGWIIAIGPLNANFAPLPFGAPLSFVALALAAVVIAWYGFAYSKRELTKLGWPLAMAASPLIAAALVHYDTVWPWTTYHALLAGWLAIAAAAAALACVQFKDYVSTAMSATLVGVVVALNFVSGWNDPILWCPLALGGGAVAILAALGVFRRQHGFAYATIPVALVIASQAYAKYVPSNEYEPLDFLAYNLLAAIVVTAGWLAVEIYRERFGTESPSRWSFPVPLLMTAPLTVAFGSLIAIGLLAWHAMPHEGSSSTVHHIAASIALGAYLVAMLWYNRQWIAIPCLYGWGLMTAAMFADCLPRHHELVVVLLPTIAAAYVAFTGTIWQSGAWLSSFGQPLGIREPVSALARTIRWLPAVTIALAALVTLADFGIVLGNTTRAARLLAGFGPVLCAIAIGMLAQQQRRAAMIYLSLLFATGAAVLLAWADLPYAVPGYVGLAWLRRTIRILVVLGALSFLYAAVLPRMWNHLTDWVAALRRMAVTSAIGAGVALVAVLILEVPQFLEGKASELSDAEVGVVAGVLVLLVATLITFAVSTRFAEARGIWADENSRMGYVYAAQLVLALAFGHMYLTRSEWFDGLLKPYWPYVVMAIAFGGVGLSEWFSRLKLRVLAEPLGRTGLFLPLLPALGWWVEASRGNPTTDYAMVMFVVGMLYAVVSMVRQSTVSAIAAGVAGNIALWALLGEREGFDFVSHPQFWLIPPALSVLAGVQLQQRRLTEAQVTTVRYICMLVIYLSSTSEIFITQLSSLWPPLILAGLAVVGVMVGIALQIRAFLYLGTGFVFLSMVTMVAHASFRFGEVWPWWAFGICVGLLMLVFFGLFEKKKAEITALVERLRQWEQ